LLCPCFFPDKLLTTKNTNATFFLIGGSKFLITNSGNGHNLTLPTFIHLSDSMIFYFGLQINLILSNFTSENKKKVSSKIAEVGYFLLILTEKNNVLFPTRRIKKHNLSARTKETYGIHFSKFLLIIVLVLLKLFSCFWIKLWPQICYWQ